MCSLGTPFRRRKASAGISHRGGACPQVASPPDLLKIGRRSGWRATKFGHQIGCPCSGRAGGVKKPPRDFLKEIAMNHEYEIRRAWQLKKRQGYKVMSLEQLDKLLKNAAASRLPMSTMLAAFQSTNFDADADIEDARREIENLNGHLISAEATVHGEIWGRELSSMPATTNSHPELSTAAVYQRRVQNQHAWADDDTFSADSPLDKLADSFSAGFEIAKQATSEIYDDFSAELDPEPLKEVETLFFA
jgi:hypothetical protein